MLSKKDYIALSNIIAQSGDEGPYLHKATLVTLLSKYLSRDNPHFDEGRFREACKALTNG